MYHFYPCQSQPQTVWSSFWKYAICDICAAWAEPEEALKHGLRLMTVDIIAKVSEHAMHARHAFASQKILITPRTRFGYSRNTIYGQIYDFSPPCCIERDFSSVQISPARADSRASARETRPPISPPPSATPRPMALG